MSYIKNAIKKIIHYDRFIEQSKRQYQAINSIQKHISGLDKELTETRLLLNGLTQELAETRQLVNGLAQELADTKRLLKDGLYNTEEERGYISSEYIQKIQPNSEMRILLCGYYGAQNGGDELMLRAMLDILKPLTQNITILLSHNYALDALTYYPYKTIHYPKKTDDCRFLAENFDIIIWGGGAVIDDTEYHYRGAHNNLTYIEINISKLAVQLNKKVLVFGVSANKELTNKRMISDLQFIIDHSQFFSLRDKNSYNTLEASGFKNLDKISIIDDIALANTYIINEKPQKDKKVVRLGFVFILDNNIKYLADFVDEIISLFPENEQLHLNLISFFNQYGHDVDRLNTLSREIAQHENVTIEIVDTELSIEGITYALQCSDYLFSMRYHATLIASFALGQNVISINYGDTHRHYYNKVKYIKDNYVPDLRELNYKDISTNSARETITKYLAESEYYQVDNKKTKDIADNIKQTIYNETKKCIEYKSSGCQ